MSWHGWQSQAEDAAELVATSGVRATVARTMEVTLNDVVVVIQGLACVRQEALKLARLSKGKGTLIQSNRIFISPDLTLADSKRRNLLLPPQ
ncbi:unnamed protein product [Lampetra planeri]